MPSDDFIKQRLAEMKATSPDGEHYRKHGEIQPIDLIESFKLPYREGSIIDKVSRWRDKGGLRDLLVARWMLDRLIIEAGGAAVLFQAEGKPAVETTSKSLEGNRSIVDLETLRTCQQFDGFDFT